MNRLPIALKKNEVNLRLSLPSQRAALSDSNNQLSNCYAVVKSFSPQDAETSVSFLEDSS